MMRKLLAATALALATTAVPANAAALFTVTLPANPTAVGLGQNNFLGPLAGAVTLNGVSTAIGNAADVAYSDLGALLAINGSGPVTIDFFLIAAESGYTNTFTATNGSQTITATEHNENFATGQITPTSYIGSLNYAAGTTNIGVNDWRFTTSNDDGGGQNAHLSETGFGFFLPVASLLGGLTYNTDTLYFGYDDQNGAHPFDDDNHDDMIIMARIAAVPESATWAMLLSGFAAVGAAMRRRRTGFRVQQAV